MRFTALIGILACVVALEGCAASRGRITLNVPEVAESTSPDAKVVVIRSVLDERVFEEAPRDPSTPSLGFGGASQAPAELKARAIARKRNAFGKALGDILLEDGQTVTDVVREHVAAALRQAGFRVAGQGTNPSGALVLDVHIKQFWSWFQPGFWALTLHTKISTDLDLSGSATPTQIRVHVQENRQAATGSAWIETMEKGLYEFRAQVFSKAEKFR